MSKIANAFAEWDDKAGAFVVYLDREGEDEPRPLSELKFDTYDTIDPDENRLVWDVMIYCLNDVGDGDARDKFFKFARKAQAERVAKRCNETLKDIAKGVPPLEGMAAQIVCMSKGGGKKGRRIPGFSLALLRGKMTGAT